MKIFIVLALVAGATASHGWTSRLKHQLHRNNSWQSERYAPEFKNAVMEDDGQAMDKDRYSIQKAKQEVINIETNFWCYVLNMCQYSFTRYVSVVSGDEKPLQFYIAVKELLELKYGTQFSHPIEGQQEKHEYSSSLMAKFKDVFDSMTKQWQQLLPGIPNVYHSIFYLYQVQQFVKAYFGVMDNDAMQDTVERMEIIRDRFNSPETSKAVTRRFAAINSDEQVVESAKDDKVDMAEKIAHLHHLIEEIFGYIFDIKPVYCSSFATLEVFSDKKEEHAAAVDGFTFALEKLYGPLLAENRKKRDGSFALRHVYVPSTQIKDMSQEIYFNWWDEVAMLSKRVGDTWWGSVRIEFMAWVNSATKSKEELEEIVKRLVQLKAMTLNNTSTTTIEYISDFEKRSVAHDFKPNEPFEDRGLIF